MRLEREDRVVHSTPTSPRQLAETRMHHAEGLRVCGRGDTHQPPQYDARDAFRPNVGVKSDSGVPNFSRGAARQARVHGKGERGPRQWLQTTYVLTKCSTYRPAMNTCVEVDVCAKVRVAVTSSQGFSGQLCPRSDRRRVLESENGIRSYAYVTAHGQDEIGARGRTHRQNERPKAEGAFGKVSCCVVSD